MFFITIQYTIHFQSLKEINKEENKVNISVANAKYVVDHFPGFTKKYGWGRFSFKVTTGYDNKNLFLQTETIVLAEMKTQAWFFGTVDIGHVVIASPSPLEVQDFPNIDTDKQQEQIFMIDFPKYYRQIHWGKNKK